MDFKEGDEVLVISNDYHSNNGVGDIGVIAKVGFECPDDDWLQVEVKGRDKDNNWHRPRELKLIPKKTTSERSMRFNSGKSEFFDAPMIALAEVSKVAAYGRAKYDKYNWKKGTNASQYYDCAMRHMLKWWYGQDNDSESKCHHLSHAAWNMLAALEMIKTERIIDDRYLEYNDDFVDNIENLFSLSSEQKQAIQEQLDKKAKNE